MDEWFGFYVVIVQYIQKKNKLEIIYMAVTDIMFLKTELDVGEYFKADRVSKFLEVSVCATSTRQLHQL